MSKALRFLQITIEHQDCPLLSELLTIKTSSRNISITLLTDFAYTARITRPLSEEKAPVSWFPVPRNTAASKIGNSVILLLITNFHLYLIQLRWQFFQIFMLVLGRYPEKLYRATLIILFTRNL